jgi:transcriptional regulator with XRE-family HTH domain
MAGAVPINGVQPQLLRWARESANMTAADVAARFNKAAEDIEARESGNGGPSYAQLERLAYEIYKRPLAIFFLPTPPDEPKPQTEFRSRPDADLARKYRQFDGGAVGMASSPHLIESVSKEMIEALDPDEAKARVFHVGQDVEGDAQGSRKEHLVHPTVPGARGHAEPGKQRAAQTKTKQHEIDDLRRMFFGSACP